MFFTCSQIILNLYGHNKGARLLVLRSEKPQATRPGIFVNMICETFQTAEELDGVWVEVKSDHPLQRLILPLLCLQLSQQGSLLNASELHAQSSEGVCS